MKLSDLITPGLIFSNLISNNKDSCLIEITKNLCLAENVLNFELTSALIKKREDLCSTALDNHIAIPHAKVPGINKIYASLSIHREGIMFGSIDNKDTNIFVLLLHPENNGNEHLEVLRNIANLFSRKEVISKILEETKPFEIYNIIKNYE